MPGSQARRRLAGAAAACAAVFLVAVVPTVPVEGAEDVKVPDVFEGAASAAGLSYTQFKSPNPLPVGPGAFFVAEAPEAAGLLDASSGEARGSVMFPGALLAGLPALLCLAGLPTCTVSGFPTVAQAKNPGHPDDRASTDPAQYKDPASPVQIGAGEGTAQARDATEGGVSSEARLGGWKFLPPSAAHAAVLTALDATLGQIPGAKLTPDPALVSFGSARVMQRVTPQAGGAMLAESTALINDVGLMAGAITIDTITITASAVADGQKVTDAKSASRYSGVFVAGFPATIGPDGVKLVGQAGPNVFDGLNGSALAIAQTLQSATGKLHMEIRSGSARSDRTQQTPRSAADGLLITLDSAALTEQSPPQPPAALCAPVNAAQESLPSEFPRTPPICVVPDVTGAADSYQIRLGRADARMSAQSFEFAADFALDTAEPAGSTGDSFLVAPPFANSGLDAGFGSLVESASTDARGRSTPRMVPVAQALFNEARWLGNASLSGLYLALALLCIGLAAASKLLIRQFSGVSRERK
ncbi:MAG TPA: hypothetical protein VMZ22_04090 [Acidimicrobiales bacterium]|nr:hypothetical protein [Acidimicrobiales bacterium]